MRCISSDDSPSASRTTATGLPRNGRDVKTSTCLNGYVGIGCSFEDGRCMECRTSCGRRAFDRLATVTSAPTAEVVARPQDLLGEAPAYDAANGRLLWT